LKENISITTLQKYGKQADAVKLETKLENLELIFSTLILKQSRYKRIATRYKK